MDRRNFLGILAAATARLALSRCKKDIFKHKRNEIKRTNVILIMADDFGYECLRSNGGEPYKTPRLDKLGAEGLRFTNCCAQPTCTPSRVKIMTGRYSFRNFIRPKILLKTETTFGHLMKSAGYKTCIVGKWQLGRDRKLIGHFGFDEYCLWWLENREERYSNVGELIQNNILLPGKEGKYGPDVVSNFMLDFISRHKDQPFFCYYPMILTHSPFLPTPDSTDPNSRDIHKNFADMVAYADKIVGRIVDHLEELGLRENTLILFTGDNGTGRDITSKLNGKPYPGGKGSITSDSGIHVPLVANWPEGGVSGQVHDDPIDFSDFLPTIADITRVELPEHVQIDGSSFAGRLRGDKNYKPREYSYICYYGRDRSNPKICARGRRYHLLKNGNMYDFIEDPLFKKPISTAVATSERAGLQAIIDRMEIERKKEDRRFEKQGQV